MIVVYHVKLNVSQPNVINGLLAKQRDSNSRFMDCAFYHEKRRLTVPTGCTAVVNAMRADGEYRSFAGSVNDDNTVRIPLTNWMLDQDGTLRCSVTVFEGDEKLTTASFEIPVEKSENPTGTVSPDDPNVDLAEQLVSQCETYAERAEAAAESIPITVNVDNVIETDEEYDALVAAVDAGSYLVGLWENATSYKFERVTGSPASDLKLYFYGKKYNVKYGDITTGFFGFYVFTLRKTGEHRWYQSFFPLTELAETALKPPLYVVLTITDDVSGTSGTTSKTAQEMTDAYLEGRQIVFRVLNYPVVGSRRDMFVTEAQYNATTSLYSFSCLSSAGGVISLIETDYLTPSDHTFHIVPFVM